MASYGKGELWTDAAHDRVAEVLKEPPRRGRRLEKRLEESKRISAQDQRNPARQVDLVEVPRGNQPQSRSDAIGVGTIGFPWRQDVELEARRGRPEPVFDGTREARRRGVVLGFHRHGAGEVVDTNDGRVSPPCGPPEHAGWAIVGRPGPPRALAPAQSLVGDDADPAGPPASAVPSRFRVLVLGWHEVV